MSRAGGDEREARLVGGPTSRWRWLRSLVAGLLLVELLLLLTMARAVGAAVPGVVSRAAPTDLSATALARLRPSSAGAWLETPDSRRFFVVGVNYQGPADQAWRMWEPERFDRGRIRGDLQRIRDGGYNTIRLFVQAPLQTDLNAERYERLDYVLEQAEAAGLRVILTLADYPEAAVATLTERAGQLARRYAGRGTILAWDLKNEPQFATFGVAQYPAGQPVPLLDGALVNRYGERLSRDEARQWRTSGEGRAVTPSRFSDEQTYIWANVLAYYREFLAAAAEWAGESSDRSGADYIGAPASAAWRPFLSALSDTILIWLAPQTEAIRAADPSALVTIGYNNVMLAVQPANRRLQLQSLHRFPEATLSQWRATFAALVDVQTTFPGVPVILEEFGYSNRSRTGQRLSEELTGTYELATWLELARRELAGGVKWMFYDFDQGANPYENNFGAVRGDGSPKMIYRASRLMASLWPGRLTSVDLTATGGELSLVARGPGLLVTAGRQSLPEAAVSIAASEVVVIGRTLRGQQLVIGATAPAELRLDTRRLLAVSPERVRVVPESAGRPTAVRVDGDRLVLALASQASVTLAGPERPLRRVPPLTGPAGTLRYFPETGHNLLGGFKGYWEANGGLAIFGLPLTEEFREVNPADGQEYTVQYFERARFEYHPEKRGTPYEVELGLLGSQLTQGREATPPFRRLSGLTDAPERRFFSATGHTLFGGFKGYWERNGGLAVFGYPLSEEFRELNPADGREYTVQYFERARFEYHPEKRGTPYEVELGLLGWQLIAGE